MKDLREQVRILVTGVGSSPAICALRALRTGLPNSYLVGTDINPPNRIAGSIFCDRCYQVPRGENPEFVNVIIDICTKERIGIVLPVIDEELLPLSKAKSEFLYRGVVLACPDPPVLSLTMDKLNFAKWLRSNGFPAPATTTLEDFLANPCLEFPVFLKPRFGRGSQHARVIRTFHELELCATSQRDMIVQEYCVGQEFTCDVLADCNSRVLAVVPRCRCEVKAGVIWKGYTTCDEQLMHLARSICSAAKITFAANVQFIRSSDSCKCIELNPRLSGGLALTVRAGVNIPTLLVRMVMGEDISHLSFTFSQIYMARFWDEVFFPILDDR